MDVKIGYDTLAFQFFMRKNVEAEFVSQVKSFKIENDVITGILYNNVEVPIEDENYLSALLKVRVRKYGPGVIRVERVEPYRPSLTSRPDVRQLATALGMKWGNDRILYSVVIPRLLPLFGINYMEISPPGTGKTELFSRGYPGFAYMASPPSLPQLVFNHKEKTYGLVASYEGIIMDEVQNWHPSKELISVLNTGLEQGLWSKGNVVFEKKITAVVLGNMFPPFFPRSTYERFHIIKYWKNYFNIIGEKDIQKAFDYYAYFRGLPRKEIQVDDPNRRRSRKLSEIATVLHMLMGKEWEQAFPDVISPGDMKYTSYTI